MESKEHRVVDIVVSVARGVVGFNRNVVNQIKKLAKVEVDKMLKAEEKALEASESSDNIKSEASIMYQATHSDDEAVSQNNDEKLDPSDFA